MQNEVFDKLYKINRKYKDVKISDVGCYELKYEDVKKISKKEMTKILFKSINDRVLLSRNSIYYDFAFCTLWRSQMRFRAVALRSITAARF